MSNQYTFSGASAMYNTPPTTGTEAINNLEMVLGRLPDSVRNEYAHEQSRTHGDLTELLLQRAGPVVTTQITGLLLNTYVSPLTQVLLPIRHLGPNDSIKQEWMELNFDQGLAPEVEVEGLARLYTHNKTKRGARAVRRGVAVKIESGFYMTPEGRQEWAFQIQQLATIIQRTNEYDIMMTLLQTPWRDSRRANELGGPNNTYSYGASNRMSFMERLQLEVDWFGIVNKSEDSRGFANLCTSMRTVMKKNGVEPDAMVVPPNMLGYYMSTSPDLWEYSSAGPDSKKHREISEDIGNDSGIRLQTFQGMKLIDTHVSRMTNGANEEAGDLLTVPKQIGEYYPMLTKNSFPNSSDFANFQSRHRAIRIFNEDHGRIVPVKFGDAIKNSMRFEADGGNLDLDMHNSLGDGAKDLFLYEKETGGRGVCDKWGDMERENLTTVSIDNVAHSVVGKLGADTVAALDLAIAKATSVGANKVLGDTIPEMAMIKMNLYQVVIDGMVTCMSWKDFGKALGNKLKLDGHLKNTENIKHLDAHLDRKRNVHRAIAFLFLTTRINMASMLQMDRTDMYVPVDFVLARPYMTYNVSSAIVMKAGTSTGETIIADQKFQMTSNIGDRTLMANYFYYGKAIVKESRNVMVAPSVFVQSYVKGNDTTFIGNKQLDIIHDQSGLLESTESLFAFMTRADDPVDEVNVIDIRGQHEHITKMPDNGVNAFYSSAAYYNTLFNIDVSGLAESSGSFVDYEDVNLRANTICFLGHTEDSRGNILYRNTGHHGSITYDGVEKSRKPGMYSPIKHGIK